MDRRQAFAAIIGLGLATTTKADARHAPSKNYHLGPDRRQWQRWDDALQSYVPVEMDEVKAGDTVLSFDVVNGNVNNVYLFTVSGVLPDAVMDTGGQLNISGSWATKNGECFQDDIGISTFAPKEDQ